MWLVVVSCTAVAVIWRATRSPAPPAIDTTIQSGRHVMFVLMAPSRMPSKEEVATVEAARDAVREFSKTCGCHFTTIGISNRWDVVEGFEILKAIGPFDELIVGRNWFNTGLAQYAGAMGAQPSSPQLLVAVDSIQVGQRWWSSTGPRELIRLKGFPSVKAWASRGYPLSLNPEPRAPMAVADQARSVELDRFMLDPRALVTIGRTDHDPLHDVVGAFLMGEQLLVAENGSSQIKVFNLDGRLHRSIGGAGEGPGEFVDLTWIQAGVDNSVLAYDAVLGRVTRFAADGELLETVTLRAPPSSAGSMALGVFDNGSILAYSRLAPEVPAAASVIRPRAPLNLLDETGEYSATVGDYLGGELFVVPVDRGRRFVRRILGRASHIAVADSVYVVVDNTSDMPSVFSSDGRILTLLRSTVPIEPRVVTEADVRLMKSRVGGSGGTRGDLIDDTPRPDVVPYFGWAAWAPRPLAVVGGQRVALLRFGGLDPTGPTWSVHDLLSGGQVGWFAAVDDVELLAFGGDHAVVLRRGEFEEHIIEVRRLVPYSQQ